MSEQCGGGSRPCRNTRCGPQIHGTIWPRGGIRPVASKRHLGLGVLETRWFDERHHTVRPLFEFLSYALKDRSDAFTYERFVGAPSFRDASRFVMSGGDVDFLYVAAHGDFGKIEASDGTGLS